MLREMGGEYYIQWIKKSQEWYIAEGLKVIIISI
jgi:hypothetical protein